MQNTMARVGQRMVQGKKMKTEAVRNKMKKKGKGERKKKKRKREGLIFFVSFIHIWHTLLLIIVY